VGQGRLRVLCLEQLESSGLAQHFCVSALRLGVQAASRELKNLDRRWRYHPIRPAPAERAWSWFESQLRVESIEVHFVQFVVAKSARPAAFSKERCRPRSTYCWEQWASVNAIVGLGIEFCRRTLSLVFVEIHRRDLASTKFATKEADKVAVHNHSARFPQNLLLAEWRSVWLAVLATATFHYSAWSFDCGSGVSGRNRQSCS